MARWLVPVVSSLLLFAASCVPDDEPPLDEFPGLSADVEIIIDDHGIPHIYGETDADVMYAAGYQVATDRLFQMDLVRRRALGRRAEVLGADFVDSDRVSRLVDLPRWGEVNRAHLRDSSPETYRLIVAWVAGVNARIEEVNRGEAPLPAGFAELDYAPEPWTLADHFTIAELFIFGNSNMLEEELLATVVERFFPEAWEEIQLARPMFDVTTMPPEALPAGANSPDVPPIPVRGGTSAPSVDPAALRAGVARMHAAMEGIPRTGSNNWAIDGRFTASGRPLIAGDPHQPLASPSVFYGQHLNSADAGGSLDVIGWAFAGVAGIPLGHNRHVAWTATTNFGDASDFWEVTLDGDSVEMFGERVEISTREETIEVKGAEPVTVVVQDVPGYGFILPQDFLGDIVLTSGDQRLVFGWIGFEATSDVEGFFGLGLSESRDDFEAAVDKMTTSGFNFVAADADGITYRVNLQVPDRGPPGGRKMPLSAVDGSDPANEWRGPLPPEKLPRTRAETRGWIATANNDPWGFTADGNLSNDPWYYGSFFAAGHRAHRIHEELTSLTAQGGLTIADMQALQTDVRSATADLVLPLVEQAYARVDSAPELESYRDRPELGELVAVLADWDRNMDVDSPGALVYHSMIMFLADEVVGDEFSLVWGTLLETDIPFILKWPLLAVTGVYPEADAVVEQGVDVALLESLSLTASLLEGRFGSVDPEGYRWGDLHGTLFDSPVEALGAGWYPNMGGEDTINVSSSPFFTSPGNPRDRFDSEDGAAYRMVAEFDAEGTPRAYMSFPPGNTEDPDSEFFTSNVEEWLAGDYSLLPFHREDVEAAEVRRFTLQAR